MLRANAPDGATPQVGRDYASELAGKVVLDAGNPRPGRDGPMAEEAVEMGAGLASQQFLPGVRLVRAFNAISAHNLRSQAHRSGEKLAIPLAGDDEAALEVAACGNGRGGLSGLAAPWGHGGV